MERSGRRNRPAIHHASQSAITTANNPTMAGPTSNWWLLATLGDPPERCPPLVPGATPALWRTKKPEAPSTAATNAVKSPV
jgi:hypothetical protein